ncbi:hypothetical protein [Streptomyces sp. NPDC090080]|uniref:hypothetical protein n=1 Tax=Streptomyces sp. NPDC090080 TaxID=3365939 RepID=UPI0038155EE4
MNIPQDVIRLASGTEGGPTFLGEDFVAWRTALIAAVVAAVIYELAMAVMRKVTLRLPFLILYLARVTISRAQWQRLHGEWVAELHHTLSDGSAPGIGRLANGFRYATSLALGGARSTAKAGSDRPGLLRQTIKESRIPLLGAWGMSAMAVQSFLDFKVGWIQVVFVAIALGDLAYAMVTVVRDYRRLRAAWPGVNRDQ